MKFRTRRDCVIHSVFYAAGVELTTVRFWPASFDVEPLDAEAKRLAHYAARHAQNPWRPRSPYDARTDSIYLPAVFRPAYFDKDAFGALRLPPIIDEADASPNMPLYVTPYGKTIGGRELPPGSRFAMLAWPLESLGLKAGNESSERVIAYMRAALACRKFIDVDDLVFQIPSPWNCWTDALHLPDEEQVLTPRQPAESPVIVIAA